MTHRASRSPCRSRAWSRNLKTHLAKIVAELPHLLVAVFGFLGQRLVQNLLQTTRQRAWPRGCQWLRRIVKDGMADVNCRLSAKRPGSGQHLVQDDAGREYVGAEIDRIPSCLLGGGMSRGSVGNADLSQLGLMNGAGTRGIVVEQLG